MDRPKLTFMSPNTFTTPFIAEPVKHAPNDDISPVKVAGFRGLGLTLIGLATNAPRTLKTALKRAIDGKTTMSSVV
jgi:hypothetical protein